jgi:hypothetical protein
MKKSRKQPKPSLKKQGRKASPRKLSLREQQARNNAFEVLRRMRNDGESLASAARHVNVTLRAVIRHVGKALVKARRRYGAKASDQLLRTLKFVTDQGQMDIHVRGSRKASLIGEYFSAVERYLLKGETDPLRTFEGKSIRIGKAIYPFVTERELLERLYYAGQFEFEDLYALGA